MRFNWSDQRIAQLKAMVADGGTARSIAAEWGVTRNTVAGKMNKLGLKRGHPAPKQKPINPQIRRHKKNRLIGPVMPVVVAAPIVKPREPLPPPPFHSGPVELNSPILALTETSCRFPIGDPHHADFHFCGAQRDGRTYCAAHAALAYRPRRVNLEYWAAAE